MLGAMSADLMTAGTGENGVRHGAAARYHVCPVLRVTLVGCCKKCVTLFFKTIQYP